MVYRFFVFFSSCTSAQEYYFVFRRCNGFTCSLKVVRHEREGHRMNGFMLSKEALASFLRLAKFRSLQVQ
jgi:hypothetical protein